MDPNTTEPQGDSEAVKKLEQDLQNLSQQQVPQEQPPATQTVPPVQTPPVQPVMETPATPPTMPATTNIPVSENPKKSSPLMVVAIILALVAVLAVVAYVFGAKLLTPQPTPTPIAVLTPSPTPDITANWNTYINSTYGYSVKLPGYISQLKIGPDNSTIINDADWNFAKTDLSSLDSVHKSIASTGAIDMEINSFPANVAQQNYNLGCTGSQLSFNQLNPTVSNTPSITGVEQYVQSEGISSISTAPEIKYWSSKVCFIKNGIGYEVSYQNYESSNPDQVFSQILPTFQFTSATPSASPTPSAISQ